MSGFEQLEQAIQPTLDPLLPEEVAFQDEELSDEVALSIVLQDVVIAESFRQSKNQVADMDDAERLYRAEVKPRSWPDGTPKSRIGMPLVLEAIEKILPTIYYAFFTSDPPFILEAKGKTTADAARAKAHVLDWAIKQAGFKEEIRLGLKTVLQYGFMIGSWGWKTSEKTIKTYYRDDAGNVKAKKDVIYINHPTYENLELRHVLVDPSCRTHDVRKGAKYIIKQLFITANDLDDLRNDPTYKNVPTREELALILSQREEPATDSMSGNKLNTTRDLQAEQETKETSVDPLLQPLELLEYWSNDRVIVALQRKIVIRNEASEFDRLPNVSCAFIDVLGAMQGFGVAKLLGGEQRLETGVINSWIDQLAMVLNPAYQMQKGLGAGTQSIKVSPGKVITESGELKPLSAVSVTTEALNAVATSEARANRRVGANGGGDMPTQALRTAEGVQAFSTSVVEKLQYFIEIFTELVFVPVLEAFLELCAGHLTPKQINEILSERDGKEYAGDILDVYNASCDIKILASSKLAAKKAAIQLVPLLVQMLQSDAVQDSLVIQGKKFNYAELLEQTMELMGWDIDALIQDMTPDDMKRAMAMNQAAGKAQADASLQAQKHQDKLEEINEQGTVRAGVQAVKHIFQSSADDPQTDQQLAQSLLGQPQQGTPEGLNGQQ
jgi:hypothetical protein